MAFGIGGSKNKQNSTGSYTGNDNFNTNSNFTETPVLPDWISNLTQSVAGGTGGLVGADPKSFIAGPAPLLTTAAGAAGNLSSTPWAYDGATDVTRGIANTKASDIAAMIPQFENPYTSSVVNATAADLDHSDNLARQQFDLQNADAFGGSGLALAKGQAEDALSRARATTLGGLRAQGYDTALTGATSQAGVNQQQEGIRLGAANQIANIAGQYGDQQRANIATQDAAAAPVQSISQATAQAPLDFQSFLTQVLSGLPLQLFAGQTGTQDQTGTETQAGTQNGSVTGTGFNANATFGH